ncbi:serine/threonine-protein kinase HT1-like isoform X1 [Hibiscus syriacus]|uniref:Protein DETOXIFICATION n=1 Tax=Hibiscus syriacus TaxID=106335 RepID=A0A6A3BS82_HIBSY|nr:serine/threonine-protein kinase HT1-like isoform X1 [Hibiscus syriacus]
MCPGSDIESLGKDLNGDHQHQLLRSYNEETGDGDKLIHSCLQMINVGDELLSIGKISGPIMMASMLIQSRTIISMLFLSHLGQEELAGGSLAMGFGNITGVCHQRSILWDGSHLRPSLRRQTILGQDPDATKIAEVFLVSFIPELIAQALLHPIRIFLKSQGITTPITMAAVCAVLLHPLINYIFTAYFQLGVKGIALALACTTFNLNLGLMVYMVVSETPLKPWHGVKVLLIFQGWKPLLTLALPSLFSVCLEWWWYEIMLFLCGLLDSPKASVAAMGILIQTTGFLYNFPYSLSSGISTRVSQALGAGQPSCAHRAANIGLVLAFLFGVSAFVVTTVLRSWWGKLFTDEPQILDLISTVLPILGLCEVGNSPQTAACGVLTGTARPKDGVRINLCSFYIVGLPVAILTTFTFKLGFKGLWFGLLAAQISCVCMMIYTLVQTDWKHQAKRADKLTTAAADKDDLETSLLTSDH